MAGSDLEQGVFNSKVVTEELVFQSWPLLMVFIHPPSLPTSLPLFLPHPIPGPKLQAWELPQ